LRRRGSISRRPARSNRRSTVPADLEVGRHLFAATRTGHVWPDWAKRISAFRAKPNFPVTAQIVPALVADLLSASRLLLRQEVVYDSTYLGRIRISGDPDLPEMPLVVTGMQQRRCGVVAARRSRSD
jgi:hypothetical protein